MAGGQPLLAFDTNGVLQQVDVDGGGRLIISPQNVSAALADGASNTATQVRTASGSAATQAVAPLLFNGTTWDRQRAVVAATLLASAERTATTQSSDQTNYNGKGLFLFVDVTAETDTPEITVSVQVKDPVSSSYATIWTAAAAIDAVGEYTYLLYPGIVTAADGDMTESQALVIPRTFRVVFTAADADAMTYSAACWILL